MTEPPRNATFTVSPMSFVSLARFATLTFAYVAIFIPIKPADPDITDPIRSAAAACHVVMTAIKTAITAITVYSTLYSY